MVLDAETLEPLHELSEIGERNYMNFLETVGDWIIFKKEHPIKCAIEVFKEILQS